MNVPASFPKTLLEAVKYFSDPDTCFAFMCEIRWPKGVSCPRCHADRLSFLSTRKLWKCLECKRQFSVKVGTIMEDSPIGLDKWLVAIWLIGGAKNGISSYEIHRALGLCQKTAWFLLHRIRLAMRQGSIEKMSGTVEADETYIGGKAKNMHEWRRKLKIQGRGATGKAIVMGLLERGPEVELPNGKKVKTSRVVTRVVKNTKRETLKPQITAIVEPGSVLYTDALKSYENLDSGYVHEAIDHAESYVRGTVHTNGLENYWSLLKRCLNGTYVSVEAAHLPAYLDEEAFRFNERKDNDSGRFRKAMGGVDGRRLTYANLTAREEGEKPRRGRPRKTTPLAP